MNDPPALEPIIARVAALIDERCRTTSSSARAVLLRLWNAVDRSTTTPAPASSDGGSRFGPKLEMAQARVCVAGLVAGDAGRVSEMGYRVGR